jgi:hypothetical protein
MDTNELLEMYKETGINPLPLPEKKKLLREYYLDMCSKEEEANLKEIAKDELMCKAIEVALYEMETVYNKKSQRICDYERVKEFKAMVKNQLSLV